MTTQNPTHLYEEIAESLRRQIARGELQPGDRLPSMRALAAQWDCTTGTVSRAYALLADEGLISSHRGSGTRVTASPLPPEQDALAWGTLVNQAERFLLEVLGQGYTPPQVQTAVSVALARWQTLQDNLPAAEPESIPENQLQFIGSHDLTTDLLAQRLAVTYPPHRLLLSYRGSLGGLMALARHEADIAGIHLWDERSDSYNEPFVRRVLPGQRVALVTLATRSIGLLLPPGNPQGVQTLHDLATGGVRWVNRQEGSGTRVWLDAQLHRQGIDVGGISGFDRVRTTHLEVAQTIQSQQATAGLGLFAAAAAYGLDFVPLAQELYQLVIPARVWETAVCQHLVAIIQSPAFKESVNTLGGYDTGLTGDVVWIT